MKKSEIKSISIHINGLVQGVGFRPFVYRLAKEFGVKGRVQNSGEGVVLEAESKSEVLEHFTKALRVSAPPMSRIDGFELCEQDLRGYESFDIVHSTTNLKSTAVSPDIAICKKCESELNDPDNRRYNYWAINCTDCGPRYSITRTVPYDRINTSMAPFNMCSACAKEYHDPHSRRYHAQPISCHECGPRLRLLDAGGVETCKDKEALSRCIEALQKGQILAVKGIGGFHLMCDATDDNAVQRLRERKRREAKPFAVMFKDMAEIEDNARLSEEEKRWIRSKERPIVVVNKKKRSVISSCVAPGIRHIGVFLPYTPLHILLFKGVEIPLVVTSANRSGEPIISEAKKLLASMEGVADLILDNEREIINAVDDSVMQVIDVQPMLLRPARGFYPRTISLCKQVPKPLLALGANQKSTLALAFDDKLILSPYIGDLESVEAFEHFERTLATFKGFYDFKPERIMHDGHPDYLTSKWAKKQAISTEAIQHHHAHILACMAEYQLDKPVLGFSFDGTGYGENGTVWGGEVMIADTQGYEHIAGFRPFRLLGGDKAVKEPRRVALSLLFECFELEEITAMSNPTVQAFSKEELLLLHRVWSQGINAPLCSSAGRIFDAVASLCGVVQKISYEGESGLKLEALYDESKTYKPYEFELSNAQIDWGTMVRAIVNEEESKEAITRFYHTLRAIVDALAQLHQELPVVLSGGVFQNKILTRLLLRDFKAQDRACFVQRTTAVNDSGIALGQAWYALHKE